MLLSHTWHNNALTEEDVRGHFEYYRNDADIARVDAFYCLFPMAMCEAWLPFNKTIIYIAGHRFSLGRCSTASLARLTQHLLEASNHGHVVAAATTYDAAYINFYTGLQPPVLRMNALWYAGWRAFPPPALSTMRAEILVAPLQRNSVPFDKELRAAAVGRFNFLTARQMYGRFNLRDLVVHRAAVVFPYVVHNSLGIVELYALGVPLFVPSPEFLFELGLVVDRLISGDQYCGASVKTLPVRHVKSSHTPDPESSKREDALHWFRLADFYVMPHITTFSSWSDLMDKLAEADFDALRVQLAEHHERWAGELVDQWAAVVEKIPSGRSVPRTYEEALQFVVRSSSVQAE
jgi:hypothetical protein